MAAVSVAEPAAERPAAGATAPITVEELHDRAAIAALAPEWERLRSEIAAAGGTAGPFLAPSWFAVYAASMASSRTDFTLLVAHRAGTIVGILPLLAERRRIAGVPARVLRSLSDDHSQRFDALVADDETARALYAHLTGECAWDVLELRDAPCESPTGVDRIVTAAEADGCASARWDAMVSPYLPLPPTVEALDRGLSSKFRSNLRRRAKKLAAEVGAIALERVPNDAGRAALIRALDDGFRLEAAGWKGDAGTAIACDRPLSSRYRALALAFAAEGKLALYFLTVGGERKAFHYAIIEGGVYYLFKPGYDPALASYGLGHLLIDAVARDLIAQGVTELDFLGDDMPWKREWTDRARPHAWRYVFRKSAFGRTLHAWKFRLAPALKALRHSFHGR
ncbi:MAG TPA: GNAT family N-acetyltransferase [Kofleriaceae bacterium]|nr:GNAT family N-acetyltransferase [Kofleriaceae bacterium]